MLSRTSDPLRSLGGILGDTLAFGIEEPQTQLCTWLPLVGSAAVPLGGLGRILWHAVACTIQAPEIELRAWMALVGSAAEPLDCLAVILRHSVAVGVQESQERLRRRVAVLRERLQLPEGRGIVLSREGVQRLLCPGPPGDDGEPEY